MKIIEGKTDRTLMEFINIKKRGNVVLSTAYNYSTEQGILYEDLLCSVEKIDDDQLEPLKQQAEMISDSEVIDIIEALIKEGTNTKMELVKATYEKANDTQLIYLRNIQRQTLVTPQFFIYGNILWVSGVLRFTRICTKRLNGRGGFSVFQFFRISVCLPLPLSGRSFPRVTNCTPFRSWHPCPTGSLQSSESRAT
jgi:hypothetical protein